MCVKNLTKVIVTPIMRKIGASEKWGSCLKSIFFYKRYSKEMDEYIGKYILYKPSAEQIKWLKKDYLRFEWKYGGSLDVDYFESKMYRKSEFTRMESLAVQGRFAWRDAIQNEEDWPVFKDKRQFYAAYSDCLRRPWMIAGINTTAEELLQFIKKCNNTIFVKDPMGCGGKDVVCYKSIDSDTALSLLKELKRERKEYIIEGHIQQCKEIYEFANSSVNTFRIITLVDKNGDVHIANALLRIGGGKSDVDNFSSGGMAAHIDVNSGVIITAAMNGRGEEFVFHPVTGKQIVGYQIPEWERYKEFAISLAKRFPGMRYVGWDIVKTDCDEMCVIEGNKDAGFGAQEGRLLYGLRPIYDRILNAE